MAMELPDRLREPKSLVQYQSLFSFCLMELLKKAYQEGHDLTFGEAWDSDGEGHMHQSLHYERLAVDLNLFVGGKWISNGDHPAWLVLGRFWESLHPACRWGGDFNDANHFSVTYDLRE